MRILLLNGTVGVGKTTVAEALGAADPHPHGVVDLDALRNFAPAPSDDPFALQLELANLRAIAPNFRAAGAQHLILAGVLESAADRERHRDALDAPVLAVVRLVADREVVAARLRRRHAGDPEALEWHLARAVELHAIQEEAALDDAVVDTSRASVAEVVRAVRAALGRCGGIEEIRGG